jgi:hypothetical protein
MASPRRLFAVAAWQCGCQSLCYKIDGMFGYAIQAFFDEIFLVFRAERLPSPEIRLGEGI